MSREDRGNESGEQRGRRSLPWLQRVLWVLLGIALLLPALYRSWRGSPEATEERGRRIDEEETGLLASPWFWRGLWVLIGGLMLLLFLYELLWLS